MKLQLPEPPARASWRETVVATILFAALLFALFYVASIMVESMASR